MGIVSYTPKYFKLSEFDCRCKCGLSGEHMSPKFLIKLDLLREKCGFPLVISSGIRCIKHNKEVGGEDNSLHLEQADGGQASDIQIYGEQAHKLLGEVIALQFGGIGIKQKGDFAERFIHLDIGTKRLWSY